MGDAVCFSLCHFSVMSRYASNQDVVRFFATHGIEVTQVLPMDASPDECLRRVRETVAASGAAEGK